MYISLKNAALQPMVLYGPYMKKKKKTGCYRNVVQIPMRDSVSVMGHVHSVCLCLFKPVQVI